MAPSLLLATATPAAAHGIGSRSDLPLPLGQVVVGAAAALAASFVALATLWTTPRLAAAADGRPLPGAAQRALRRAAAVARVLSAALLAVVLWAAWTGPDDVATNLAPVALYVALWVGLQLASALLGDVWADLSPFDTVARAVERVRTSRLAGGSRPRRDLATTHWPAVATLGAFLWLELAYHAPASPRVVGAFLTAYGVVLVAGAARWGRGWLRAADGLGVLFTSLAAMAPLHRDDTGRIRLRPPFTGLATVEVRPGTTALVLLVLGATSFDGLSRTRLWADVIEDLAGWELTGVRTVGLLWVIAIVWLAYSGASRLSARATGESHVEVMDAYAPSLLPIALAYAIAHYFSLLVFEGQSFLFLLSDPAGRGWDLFGTASGSIDYRVVSTGTIALVQATSIVVGHVVAVGASHDRALERTAPGRVVRSQLPYLVVMITYTVGGLLLLLNA